MEKFFIINTCSIFESKLIPNKGVDTEILGKVRILKGDTRLWF